MPTTGLEKKLAGARVQCSIRLFIAPQHEKQRGVLWDESFAMMARWQMRTVYLSPAVVMAALLGACTTSTMDTVRLYNPSAGQTVQCGPFFAGQPRPSVDYYLTHGFMHAEP